MQLRNCQYFSNYSHNILNIARILHWSLILTLPIEKIISKYKLFSVIKPKIVIQLHCKIGK